MHLIDLLLEQVDWYTDW